MDRFVVVDDDRSIRRVISNIIDEYRLGEVCGEADNGHGAEELVLRLKPDIVVIDLLLPLQDGIETVRRLKEHSCKSYFVMLSQVDNKEMIAQAYENGIEFFIQKPINIIEVFNIIKRVQELIKLKRTVETIEETVLSLKAKESVGVLTIDPSEAKRKKLKYILSDLGIVSDSGGRDIYNLILIILDSQGQLSTITDDYQLNELYKLLMLQYQHLKISASPDIKSVEMRIRRAITKAFQNLASMGIEDYNNEKFIHYGHLLFDFKELKTEMDHLRGKSPYHGRISVKKFIEGLLIQLED